MTYCAAAVALHSNAGKNDPMAERLKRALGAEVRVEADRKVREVIALVDGIDAFFVVRADLTMWRTALRARTICR